MLKAANRVNFIIFVSGLLNKPFTAFFALLHTDGEKVNLP
jgi:hypothetical protein